MNEDIKRNIAVNANISLYQSQLNFIDRYRIGHSGFKDRSKYIQALVDKDIKFRRLDFLGEIMGFLMTPIMGFFIFMVLSVLTKGLLFYSMMIIFGGLVILLGTIYYQRRKLDKNV